MAQDKKRPSYSVETVAVTASTILCPKCNSNNITKNGKIKGRQRYFCVDCKTNFLYPTKAKYEEVEHFPCPLCDSMNVRNKGLKHRRNIRQFYCKDCGNYFNVILFCFLEDRDNPKVFERPTRIKQQKPQKPKLQKPITQKPRKRRQSEKKEMQEIKDNYVNQTVDSLVGVPCFCCSEISKCNPCVCTKLGCLNDGC
jgi:transposase-like protein